MKLTRHMPTIVACSTLAAFAVWGLRHPNNQKPTPSRQNAELRLRSCVQNSDCSGLAAAATEWMRVSSDHVEAARLLGYAALAQGSVAEAEKHFIRAECLSSGHPPKSSLLLPDAAATRSPLGFLWSADLAARNGDTQAAVGFASNALALAPSFSLARLFRASLNVRDNRFDLALDDLAQIGRDDPVWKEARLIQALIHLSQGYETLAEGELRPLIESGAVQPLALNAMGVIRALAGNWPEAAEAFAKAYSESPQFADAKNNWRLARGAVESPGTVLALRTEVMEANSRALEAIRQGNSHSLASAWGTAAGDTMRDLSPYAKGAGAIGQWIKNPALAIGGTFSGEFLNRAGERSLQDAARNAGLASRADQEWDRNIGEIMRVGAQMNPGSFQARAYEQRLARVQVSPVADMDSTLGKSSGIDARGGVKAELTAPTWGTNGRIVFATSDSSTNVLVVAYPIFLVK